MKRVLNVVLTVLKRRPIRILVALVAFLASLVLAWSVVFPPAAVEINANELTITGPVRTNPRQSIDIDFELLSLIKKAELGERVLWERTQSGGSLPWFGLQPADSRCDDLSIALARTEFENDSVLNLTPINSASCNTHSWTLLIGNTLPQEQPFSETLSLTFETPKYPTLVLTNIKATELLATVSDKPVVHGAASLDVLPHTDVRVLDPAISSLLVYGPTEARPAGVTARFHVSSSRDVEVLKPVGEPRWFELLKLLSAFILTLLTFIDLVRQLLSLFGINHAAQSSLSKAPNTGPIESKASAV